MTSSLVGSEMCIRDSLRPLATRFRRANLQWVGTGVLATRTDLFGDHTPCLLYTSDAADDM
eukprot:10768537-Prorocentrum_lima.AAC.1